MIDAEIAILEELDRLAPFEQIETGSALDRRGPGRRLAILLPLLLLLLATAAIALSASVRAQLGL